MCQKNPWREDKVLLITSQTTEVRQLNFLLIEHQQRQNKLFF